MAVSEYVMIRIPRLANQFAQDPWQQSANSQRDNSKHPPTLAAPNSSPSIPFLQHRPGLQVAAKQELAYRIKTACADVRYGQLSSKSEIARYSPRPRGYRHLGLTAQTLLNSFPLRVLVLYIQPSFSPLPRRVLSRYPTSSQAILLFLAVRRDRLSTRGSLHYENRHPKPLDAHPS